MKTMCNTRTFVASILFTWVVLTSSSAIGDGPSEQIAIPDTPAGIWQSIDEQISTLDELVSSGELEEVHHHAFGVRDLVRALEDSVQGLNAESVEQITTYVGYVETLAARLDETGDENDIDGTKENLQKLKRILAGIRANYPDVQ